jgi:hypothetical protein
VPDCSNDQDANHETHRKDDDDCQDKDYIGHLASRSLAAGGRATGGFRYDLSGLALMGWAPVFIRELPRGGALADEEPAQRTTHKSFGFFVKQDRPLKALIGEHSPGSGPVFEVDAEGHD